MSYARYARFLPGGPQRRVFFPDFYMKMVRTNKKHPPNVVVFHCPVQMTKHDVKNYLEQIYKVPVARVNTAIQFVPILRDHRNRRWVPEEDYRRAFVTLGEGETFEFPDLFQPQDEKENREEVLESVQKKEREKTQQLAARGGLSSWFGV